MLGLEIEGKIYVHLDHVQPLVFRAEQEGHRFSPVHARMDDLLPGGGDDPARLIVSPLNKSMLPQQLAAGGNIARRRQHVEIIRGPQPRGVHPGEHRALQEGIGEPGAAKYLRKEGKPLSERLRFLPCHPVGILQGIAQLPVHARQKPAFLQSKVGGPAHPVIQELAQHIWAVHFFSLQPFHLLRVVIPETDHL